MIDGVAEDSVAADGQGKQLLGTAPAECQADQAGRGGAGDSQGAQGPNPEKPPFPQQDQHNVDT